MKRFLISFLIVILSFSLAACGSTKDSSSEANKTTSETSSFETADFQVTGMTCSSCPFIVESAISELDGVKEVKVQLPDQAAVTFDPSVISLDQIKQAVLNVGYEVN
jgi:copper ion binding protein